MAAGATELQIAKQSWERLGDEREVFVATVFQQLFSINPQLTSLIPADFTRRQQAFLALVNLLVYSSGNFAELRDALVELGRTHRGRGVTREHCDLLIELFAEALPVSIGAAADEEREISAAWRALLGDVTQQMQPRLFEA